MYRDQYHFWPLQKHYFSASFQKKNISICFLFSVSKTKLGTVTRNSLYNNTYFWFVVSKGISKQTIQRKLFSSFDVVVIQWWVLAQNRKNWSLLSVKFHFSSQIQWFWTCIMSQIYLRFCWLFKTNRHSRQKQIISIFVWVKQMFPV